MCKIPLAGKVFEFLRNEVTCIVTFLFGGDSMCCKLNFEKVNDVFRRWRTRFLNFEEAIVAVNKKYECFRVEIEWT